MSETETSTLDQNTTERAADFDKATECHGSFLPKENLTKGQPKASLNKVIKNLEAVHLVDDDDDDDEEEEEEEVEEEDEEKPNSSNCVRLRRNRELDRELREQMKRKMSSHKYKSMNGQRKKLPTYAKKQEFLNLVDKNQVVVIIGETGSGKTTQLPQYMLEHAVLRDNGSCTRIVVTQPRRISAISVAERVANERGESLGLDIGYQIRLKAKLPARNEGSILYCTTGVILQWFRNDPLLKSLSHIVVDEVHERVMLDDFLMVMLKRILPRRPELRVILMSATMNWRKFSEYFGNCPHLEIPGRTFHVESIFLEDVLRNTGYQMPIEARGKFIKLNESKNLFSAKSIGEPYITAEIREEYERWVHKCYYLSLGSQDFLKLMDINLCPPPEFIAYVIDYIAKKCDPGAILVFVPGRRDIKDVMKELRKIDKTFYGKGSNRGSVIYPLHSRLDTKSQRAVFRTPPDGKRKIIIATNMAETSITIEDIVYVVDSGQVKITTYDPSNNTSTLAPVLVSKSNAIQRMGRAGRAREGKCFYLFSSFTYKNVMLDYLPPEITRMRLENLILRIKVLNLGPVTDFLSACLDPPDLKIIHRSLRFLREIQALKLLIPEKNEAESVDSAVDEDNYVLTPLGYHLANFPLDPQCTKLLILGALFRCLKPAIAVAACLTFKVPFEEPLEVEYEAEVQRREFIADSQSDHWALYSVLEEFRQLPHEDRGNFCDDNFINFYTMQDLLLLMQDFVELLYEYGYIKSLNMDDPDMNIYSDKLHIFRAIIAGAFYPNFIMASATTEKRSGLVYSTSTKGERIVLHPKSVNNGVKPKTEIWFAYFTKMKLHRGAESTVFDTTLLNLRPVVFFSSKLDKENLDDEKHLKVDDWITVINFTETQLVKSLKQGFNDLLHINACNSGSPSWQTRTHEAQLIQAIVTYFLNEAEPDFIANPLRPNQTQQGQGKNTRGRDGRRQGMKRWTKC